MAYSSLDRVLLAGGKQLDDVRQDLYFADTNLLGKRRASTWRQIHGTSYVHIAACLEVTVKGLLRALIDEIDGKMLSYSRLRTSLFALIGDSQFSAISATTKARHDKRLEIFDLLDSSATCSLNNAVLPLDGGTLRPHHFDVIWAVFGLPMMPLPEPRHRLALTSIADARNDVAHGDSTPVEVSSRQSISDTIRQLERAEEILIHLHTNATEYLDSRGFLR